VSYDHNLILDDFLERVRQAPARSLLAISREMKVSCRTLEYVLFSSARKRFKEIQGEILVAVVRTEIVRDHSLTIKELSFSLGFKSPRTFARAIRRSCGMSPIELRTSMADAIMSCAVLAPSNEPSHRLRRSWE
jgi:AraC-like DNA-binding protein